MLRDAFVEPGQKERCFGMHLLNRSEGKMLWDAFVELVRKNDSFVSHLRNAVPVSSAVSGGSLGTK